MAPFADLYIAPMPDAPAGRVGCAQRQARIDAAETETGRRQRYFVWKLLELALERSIGTAQVAFFQEESGKWGCDRCHFSLSHSENAVAVAVSDAPEEEKEEWLLQAWCARESLFKREGGGQFLTRKTEGEKIPSGIVELDGQRYAYAAATDADLNIITDIVL